jgi:hypothetical protein
MHVRCGSDSEIYGAAPRLTASGPDSRRKATPLSRNGRVDWKRIECRLDHTESLRPTSAFFLVPGHEYAEMQLCERCGTDRALYVAGAASVDEHRGVEQRSRHANGSGISAGKAARSLPSECGAVVLHTCCSLGPVTHALRDCGPS